MTPTLTAEIAAAVALRDCATPGPWALDPHTGDIESADRRVASTQNGGIFDVNNAALIAASHAHVELIVKLAERVGELERMGSQATATSQSLMWSDP